MPNRFSVFTESHFPTPSSLKNGKYFKKRLLNEITENLDENKICSFSTNLVQDPAFSNPKALISTTS